jgi:cytidylate kinase
MTAKQVMEASTMQLFESPTGMVLAGRLARYFLASKKDFIQNYLKASIEVAGEFDKTAGVRRGDAKTEEEEEAQMKASREDGKKRAAEVVQKVHEKVCKWSDKEWTSLDNAFASFK